MCVKCMEAIEKRHCGRNVRGEVCDPAKERGDPRGW